MDTLPDYIAPDLDILSIGLNPSLPSVAAGFYFANPRNRFWRALADSGLAPGLGPPGREALETLLHSHRIGFTDVVKRPSAGSAALRAADYRRWAPVLHDKLVRYRPRIAWFHGKLAYRAYLRYATDRAPGRVDWGRQRAAAGPSVAFVTPNPSPANAAFSLAALVSWYAALRRLRDQLALGGA